MLRTRRLVILVALAATVFALAALAAQLTSPGSAKPTQIAGWTWDASFDD
jgi:hypothetical protein